MPQLFQRLLEQNSAEPAVELEANTAHAAHFFETKISVKLERYLGPAIRDDRDYLLESCRLGAFDKSRHECASKSLPVDAARRYIEFSSVNR